MTLRDLKQVWCFDKDSFSNRYWCIIDWISKDIIHKRVFYSATSETLNRMSCNISRVLGPALSNVEIVDCIEHRMHCSQNNIFNYFQCVLWCLWWPYKQLCLENCYHFLLWSFSYIIRLQGAFLIHYVWKRCWKDNL